MEKKSFYSLPLDEVQELFTGLGKEKFRARQIFKWVYEKNITDLDEMTNLSKDFRQQLDSLIDFKLPEIVDHRKSIDGTQKFLFDVGEGMTVESVLIPSDDRNTLCISSEVGCNIACKFCFTGKQKLKKRLSAAEIVGQFVQVKNTIAPLRISNVVFMGMGEPLDNSTEVFKTIEIFKNDFGLNLGRKKITVSTAGLVPQIPLITRSGTRLAVSLNAPNDDIRNKIMPINRKYPLKELMQACRDHAEAAKDRVTFEYVVLNGVNDHIDHAKQVAQLVRTVPCKINLIPFNEHPDADYQRSPRSRVFQFQRYLLDKDFNVTIRRTMGRDIFAACGQLTSLYKGRPQKQDVQTGILG